MKDVHVALEFSGTDAHESQTIAMFGIHVGLDLENEARKTGVLGCDDTLFRSARQRRGREFEESVEQKLYAEVIDGAAEENRRELAVQDRSVIESRAGAVEHGQF